MVEKVKKAIYFPFREKDNIYLKRNKKNLERLKDIKLIPGIKVLYNNVKITKQNGFGRFNFLAYQKRNYRHYQEKDTWFILTNLNNASEVVELYKKRYATRFFVFSHLLLNFSHLIPDCYIYTR